MTYPRQCACLGVCAKAYDTAQLPFTSVTEALALSPPNLKTMEFHAMTYLSSLGQSAHRFAAQLLPAVTLALVLVSPAAAQPLAQAGGLESSAPDNLRCPGRPGPKDGFHFESQWQNVATYAGRVEPIALDHSCNLYVVDQ